MNYKKVNVLPNISWVVEVKGILVIETDASMRIFLAYPEAAAWSILLKYGVSSPAIDILSAIINKPENTTKEFIEKSLFEWETTGLISAS